MDKVRSSLIVFFEDPFWIGVYERQDGNVYEVIKVTFGAMPEAADILSLVLSSHRLLWYREKTAETDITQTAVNPKRKRRQAVREMSSHGVGTKSQQALSRQREMQKQEAKARAKEKKKAKAAYQYARKEEKRKEKHRGH